MTKSCYEGITEEFEVGPRWSLLIWPFDAAVPIKAQCIDAVLAKVVKVNHFTFSGASIRQPRYAIPEADAIEA